MRGRPQGFGHGTVTLGFSDLLQIRSIHRLPVSRPRAESRKVLFSFLPERTAGPMGSLNYGRIVPLHERLGRWGGVFRCVVPFAKPSSSKGRSAAAAVPIF